MEILSVVLIILAFLVIVGVAILLWRYYENKANKEVDQIQLNKIAQTQIIIFAGFAIIFLLFVSGLIVHAVNGSGKFLVNLAITIIISWIILLICYYAWALYFYNINMGWSDDRWTRFRQEQEDPTVEPDARNKNPHDEQTLGLPPGTVRGTIALSLLIGALSLTIASFGMENATKPNLILIDNFDFYKKAFLMMIAFYFGTKSLEILQQGDSKSSTTTGKEQTTSAKKTDEPSQPKPIVKEVKLETFQKDFTDPNALG